MTLESLQGMKARTQIQFSPKMNDLIKDVQWIKALETLQTWGLMPFKWRSCLDCSFTSFTSSRLFELISIALWASRTSCCLSVKACVRGEADERVTWRAQALKAIELLQDRHYHNQCRQDRLYSDRVFQNSGTHHGRKMPAIQHQASQWSATVWMRSQAGLWAHKNVSQSCESIQAIPRASFAPWPINHRPPAEQQQQGSITDVTAINLCKQGLLKRQVAICLGLTPIGIAKWPLTLQNSIWNRLIPLVSKCRPFRNPSTSSLILMSLILCKATQEVDDNVWP